MIITRHIGTLCNRSGASSNLLSKCFKSFSTVSATDADVRTAPKWQLIAAACIMRPPVICAELTEMEQRYKDLQMKIEDENSLKSGHELRIVDDKIRQHLAKEEGAVSLEDAAKQTAAEFEDASTMELENFALGEKLTVADKSGDLSSINRALDRSLVLVVKQKLGLNDHWLLPQAPWTPGESIRETCDRALKNACADKYKLKVLGNSPCGFYKYKYPKEIRKEGFVGAKVFFFSVHLMNYSLHDPDHKPDPNRLWLTREQLSENMNKSYFQAISQFILPDN